MTIGATREGTTVEAVTLARERPVAVIRPTKGWAAPNLLAVWKYRDLLYFLVWRDVKVRYKQTILGVAWAVLQPLLTMMLLA
jgi:lipopolysaccharide transport system permease protein